MANIFDAIHAARGNVFDQIHAKNTSPTDEANKALSTTGIKVSEPFRLPNRGGGPLALREPSDDLPASGAPGWIQDGTSGKTRPFTEKDEAAQSPLSNFLDSPYKGAQEIGEGAATMSDPSMERKAHGAHQVLSGAAGIAAPFVAPTLVSHPVAVGLGITAQKGVQAGAKGAGLPGGYSELLGDAAGTGTAFSGQLTRAVGRGAVNGLAKVGRVAAASPKNEAIADFVPVFGKKVVNLGKAVEAERNPAPVTPEPFKPGSSTQRNMPQAVPGYAGQEYSPPRPVTRGKFTPPPEVAEATPPPFSPGKTTQRNMPAFSPGEQNYGQPGKTIPRGNFTPPVAAEIIPEAPKPFKPGANTKRNMPKFRPGGTDYGTPSVSSRNRPMAPKPVVKVGELGAEGGGETNPLGGTQLPPEYENAYPAQNEGSAAATRAQSPASKKGAQTVKTNALARFLRDHEYTPEEVGGWKVGGKEYAQAAAEEGVNPPGSAETAQGIVARLKELGPKKQGAGRWVPKLAHGGVVIPKANNGRFSRSGRWYGPKNSIPKMPKMKQPGGPPPMPA